MTDATETQVQPESRGLPPGATDASANLSQGQTQDLNGRGVSKAPEISDRAPVKEPTAEEKAKLAEAEAAKAAEAKVEETKTDETKVEEKVEFVKYDHPAADAAVERLKELNVAPDVAAGWFKKVQETGNIADIDFEGMKATLGEKDAVLIKAAVSDYYTTMNQGYEATAKVVTEITGGLENFNKIRDWANKQSQTPARAAEFEALYKMLEQGAHSAKLAAKELKSMYEADSNNSSLTKRIVTGDGTPDNGSDNGESIARQDYLTQMKAANAKNDQKEIQRLRALRAKSLV